MRRTIKSSGKEGSVSREDARKAVREVAKSRLQRSEIYLSDVSEGVVVVEPRANRAEIQLQLNTDGLKLYRISPEEAHALGSSLVEHARECGYDPDTGETKPGCAPGIEERLRREGRTFSDSTPMTRKDRESH